MKLNENIKRLSALALASGLVIATASADSATIKNTSDTPSKPEPTPISKEVKKTHAHPWLGVIAKNSHAPKDSNHAAAPDVKLKKVYRGSPAYQAGLREGDVVWKFDGKRLKSAKQLQREVRRETPGAIVPVVAFHHGQRETLKVTLEGRSSLPGAHHYHA